MKKLLTIIFLFSYTLFFAQGKFTLINKIDVTADFFTTDNQCNIYVVKGNELTKYDKSGIQLYKYSNKNFQNISFVDASNMLKILVFYKDFMQIVFLDNTLSENGDPINISSIGFQQAQLVCSSHNNGVWLYDQQNFELDLLDANLQKVHQTGNLNALLNQNFQPNYLLEYNNKVYINSPSQGILIFDIYGTYSKIIPIKNLNSFQPIGSWIYFFSKEKITSYNIETTEEKEFDVPIKEFQTFRLELGELILKTNNSIYLYTSEN